MKLNHKKWNTLRPNSIFNRMKNLMKSDGSANLCVSLDSRFGKKLKYLALNLIAPGIGQFALRRWVRGVLMLISSLFFLAGFLWEFIKPVLIFAGNILAEEGIKVPVPVGWLNLLIFFSCLTLLWIWSMADILLSENPE